MSWKVLMGMGGSETRGFCSLRALPPLVQTEAGSCQVPWEPSRMDLELLLVTAAPSGWPLQAKSVWVQTLCTRVLWFGVL